MKKRNKLIGAIGVFAGLLWGSAMTAGAAEHSHQHDDQHAAAGELKPNNGKKWAADDALLRGMGGIRNQIAEHLHAEQAGKVGPAQYNILAKGVNGQLGYIFQNCRLNKEADAALHQILAQVIAGVEILEGKQTGVERREGVRKIASALESYPTYFVHPGWKPLQLKH